MIIAITGMPGSGKTTAAEVLKRRGFKVVELSEPIKRLMKDNGIELTAKNTEAFTIKLLKSRGRNVVSRLAIPQIRKMKGDVALSGIRRMEDVKMVEKALKTEIPIIAVTAIPKERYKRIRHRHGDENIVVKNYKEFLWRDMKNRRLGVLKTIEHANFIISNSGTRADLSKNLVKTIALIRARQRLA